MKKEKSPPSSEPSERAVSNPQIEQLFQAAMQLHQAGNLPEAEALYRQILDANPEHADTNHLLGVIAHQEGDNEIAVELISKALRENPSVATYYFNLGITLEKMGQLDDAIDSYRKALALEPNAPLIHYNLGVALQTLAMLEEAVGVYEQALRLDPEYAEAHGNLGNVLADLNRFDEAVDSFRRALRIKPDFAAAHTNLGNVLRKQGLMGESLEHHREALRINPEFVEAHSNLGIALKKLRRFDEALEHFREALRINPEFGEVHSNLGTTLNKMGRIDDALASLHRALEIDPSLVVAHSNLIFIQDFCSKIGVAEQQAEIKRWNERFMSPLAEKIKPHANSRDPDRRIRIGYVSADFKEHSACFLFAPLILDHDQEHFDIFCYDGNTVADLMTERLRSAATGWRSSAGLSDDALADRIREDSIDILVDLSGHSMGNRLLVFGQKPAPLQVTGIGHMPPGSPTIDYRLTSELYSPPAEEHLYPEKAVYLNVAMGFLPPQESPLVGPGPGAENGDFIFGSFNRLEKISNEALNLWAGILRDVPKSRLLMKSNGLEVRAARERYEDLFSDLGILPERLILLGGTSQREHLETHDRVEISLDTFPHGGGVTTLESLWMGVPVLGLCDYSKNVNRAIKVLCDPLDLGNWATESLDEYHQTAVDWTSKREALADLRQGLRDRVAEVYFRFPLEVEKSYRVMWARWCAGESPTAIDISNGA